MTSLDKESLERAWQTALWLAIFTILYNLAEGLVSAAAAARASARSRCWIQTTGSQTRPPAT